MNIRLKGFDYTRPYYYMVTLRRLDGLIPFSAIEENGRLRFMWRRKHFQPEGTQTGRKTIVA